MLPQLLAVAAHRHRHDVPRVRHLGDAAAARARLRDVGAFGISRPVSFLRVDSPPAGHRVLDDHVCRELLTCSSPWLSWKGRQGGARRFPAIRCLARPALRKSGRRWRLQHGSFQRRVRWRRALDRPAAGSRRRPRRSDRRRASGRPGVCARVFRSRRRRAAVAGRCA